MAFPRAAAVAELGWSNTHDWSGFRDRMATQLERYRALKIGFSPGAFEVGMAATLDASRSSATISLSTQAGLGDIRFTLDGTAPEPQSPLYSGAFAVKLPARLKAAAFFDGHALTEPMAHDLSPLSLLHRDSRELKLCSERLPLALASAGKVFLVDILNPCWIYEKADLDGIVQVDVGAAQLPFNFSIGSDRDRIALRPSRTSEGELEVHLDSCDTAPAAIVPLGPAVRRGAIRTFSAPLAGHGGVHDLCFVFTGKSLDPFWALNFVQLRLQR
jgi:hexosaminidase